MGKSLTCTLGGASGLSSSTRFLYRASARNGANGESSADSSVRHVQSVQYAADLSSCSSSSSAARQKRRRERRTYQFDRSSMNSTMRREARSESYASRDSSTSKMSWCSSERIQRSIGGRKPGAGGSQVSGSNSSMFA